MTSGDLTELTIKEATHLLRLGSISASDLVTAHVERIEQLDARVKAYLRMTQEVEKLNPGDIPGSGCCHAGRNSSARGSLSSP